MFDRYDLKWDDDRLRLISGQLVATLERDPRWPAMWRARLPDGRLSDLTTRTRALDAAITMALASLNQQRKAAA
jgi:hypothetical protein